MMEWKRTVRREAGFRRCLILYGNVRCMATKDGRTLRLAEAVRESLRTCSVSKEHGIELTDYHSHLHHNYLPLLIWFKVALWWKKKATTTTLILEEILKTLVACTSGLQRSESSISSDAYSTYCPNQSTFNVHS